MIYFIHSYSKILLDRTSKICDEERGSLNNGILSCTLISPLVKGIESGNILACLCASLCICIYVIK